MMPKDHLRKKSLKTNYSLSGYTSLVENGYFEPVVRNVLQHNNGNGTFSDIGCLAGIFETDWEELAVG